MDLNKYLFEGERVLWTGRPSGFPLGWWVLILLYMGTFAAAFGFPFHAFLVDGTPSPNVTINGRPLNSDMPHEDVWTTIWTLLGVATGFLLALSIFTWRRMAQRYALTSTKLLILVDKPFQSRHTVLLTSVIKHHTRRRGRLKTTVIEYNPPKTLLHRLYGIGRMAIHDYRTPPEGLGTMIDQAIAEARRNR